MVTKFGNEFLIIEYDEKNFSGRSRVGPVNTVNMNPAPVPVWDKIILELSYV
jgi:hypothetical protein